MEDRRKRLLQDASRIFTRSSHKEVTTLVTIFIHCGPLRLHHETLARSSYKVLPENSKDLFTRILGNQSKSAPRQNESDRTRTKCREGCGARSKFAPRHSESDPMRTKSRDSHHATTRRSDMHKVTRGLRVSAVVVYKVLRHKK